MLCTQSETKGKTLERWKWRERESKRDFKFKDINFCDWLWVGYKRTMRQQAADTG